VEAKIVNRSGALVANVVLGSQAAGAHQFDLATIPGAPKIGDGTYAVVVTQADPAGGAATTISTSVTGRVTGVDLTGDTPVLLLGKRQLVLADVTEIKEAAADTAP
jgi:flagellar basal-body rod modification protein FlgD